MEYPLERQADIMSNRCQMGAEIILKRLFKKLFNQVDALQPSELDDEFIYQSTITYDDYLAMVKQDQDDQLNCASLNRLENILSNLMSPAIIRRPMHTSMLTNLWFSSGLFSPNSPLNESGLLNLHLLIVLFVVCMATWFLWNFAGMRYWTSVISSMLLVGFIEFCIHKNELVTHHRLAMERCRDPPLIARIAYWFNYDYDGCRSGKVMQKENIAFIGMDYLSEIILRPIVHFGEKFGLAMQSYLSSFTGFNYLLAPIFPIILTIMTPYVIYLLFAHRNSLRPRHQASIQQQSAPPLEPARHKPEPISYHEQR